MKTVDPMHERTGEFSTKDADAPWKVLFVNLKTVFRQSH